MWVVVQLRILIFFAIPVHNPPIDAPAVAILDLVPLLVSSFWECVFALGDCRSNLPLTSSLSGGSVSRPASVASLDGGGAGGPVGTVLVPGSASGDASGGRGGGEGRGVGARDLPLVGEATLDGGGANLVGTGDLGLLDTGGVLVLLGLGVAVEVQVGHDVPLGLAGSEGTTEAEDLTGEEPPDKTNGVTTIVVGGDGSVDVLGGGVGVAEGDDGNVDVRSLLDGLGVGAGVGDDDQAGLLERAGDVVGEATGGEATSDGGGTGVGSELEDSALAVGTGRDDANVGRVVNGDDDAGSEDNILPTDFVRRGEKFKIASACAPAAILLRPRIVAFEGPSARKKTRN